MVSVEALVQELTRRGLIEVLDIAAADHFVSREEILGRSRLQSAVAGRRATCRALREHGLSYPEIGRLIDRDHTTIMNLVREEGRKKLPTTIAQVNVHRSMRPRCALCDATYDAHLSKPPHALPARGCLGFAIPAAEAG